MLLFVLQIKYVPLHPLLRNHREYQQKFAKNNCILQINNIDENRQEKGQQSVPYKRAD